MSSPNIYNIPLPDDDPAPKDKGVVSPRVGVVTRRQSKPRTPEYSSTPTLSASSSTSGINSVSRSTQSETTASPATRRRLRSTRAKATSSTDNYEDRASSFNMSSPNIYNIPLPDDDPAPKDKGAVSPRVGVLTRRQSKPRTPQYSSTPTLSAISSTSGINSVSRSTDSDPTASPATRRRLRSSRAKATSSTVKYDNYEDRVFASLSPSPQDAEDSEDTQSEHNRTPLKEGGSVDIPMTDDTEVDDRSTREGVGVFVKVLACIGFGLVLFLVVIVVVLVAEYFWYRDVPQIPVFASKRNRGD